MKKELANIRLEKDRYQPWVINITAEVNGCSWFREKIGRYDFLYKYGYLELETNKDGTNKYKEYKRFSAIMNVIFKMFPNFGWYPSMIDEAKEAAYNEEQKRNKVEESTNETVENIEIEINNNEDVNPVKKESSKVNNIKNKQYNKCNEIMNHAKKLYIQGFASDNDIFLMNECLRSIERLEIRLSHQNNDSLVWDSTQLKNTVDEFMDIYRKISSKHIQAEKIITSIQNYISWMHDNIKDISCYSDPISRAMYHCAEMDQLLDREEKVQTWEYNKLYDALDVLNKNFKSWIRQEKKYLA